MSIVHVLSICPLLETQVPSGLLVKECYSYYCITIGISPPEGLDNFQHVGIFVAVGVSDM